MTDTLIYSGVRTLQAQIDEIAACHGIVVVQKPRMAGMMFVEEQPPRIEIPTLEPWVMGPSVNICYMTALHEIGHCVHGHTQGRPPFQHLTYYFDHGILRSECEAWNFALDLCLVALTQRDCSFMAERFLGSYIARARQEKGKPCRLTNGNRHWVEAVFDPETLYVQTTLSRLRDAWKETP